jgi:hypothetical protein
MAVISWSPGQARDLDRNHLTAVVSIRDIHWLYAQKQTDPEGAAALDDYLSQWVRWAYAGLECNLLDAAFTAHPKTKEAQPQQE